MYREVVLRCDVSECFGKENKGKIGECLFCYSLQMSLCILKELCQHYNKSSMDTVTYRQ
jgi:hypothetical protein